jgi:hypothetical protein
MRKGFRIFALALVLAAAYRLQDARAVTITPTLCGDPCTVEGARVPCQDRTSDPWRRTYCYCTQGYLTC